GASAQGGSGPRRRGGGVLWGPGWVQKQLKLEEGSGTDRTISDVHVISIVGLVMIGDFQSKGTSRLFPGTQIETRKWKLEEGEGPPVSGARLWEKTKSPIYDGVGSVKRH